MNKTVLLVGVIALGLFAVCTPSLFANICGPKLEGAWQPDDFGTRVEITGDDARPLAERSGAGNEIYRVRGGRKARSAS